MMSFKSIFTFITFLIYSGIAFAQAPGNDNPEGAMGVLLGDTLIVNNIEATGGGPPMECSFGNDADLSSVWFRFVVPEIPGMAVFRTFDDGNATLMDTRIQLIRASDEAIILCDSDGGEGLFSEIQESFYDLGWGETYYIQIDGFNGGQGICSFSLTFEDIIGCADPCCYGLQFDPRASIHDYGGDCCYGIYLYCWDPESWNYASIVPEGCGPCWYNQPDLNGDGQVNSSDLTIFLNLYGCSNADCWLLLPDLPLLADFNSDGIVNPADLLIFIQAVGE